VKLRPDQAQKAPPAWLGDKTLFPRLQPWWVCRSLGAQYANFGLKFAQDVVVFSGLIRSLLELPIYVFFNKFWTVFCTRRSIEARYLQVLLAGSTKRGCKL
jgi:hypothetical protein